MKISIITPTYNDAVSIRETYQSIVGQTYREWEWIVINDGSTDNTREIIEKIQEEQKDNNKIIYREQANADQLNAIIHAIDYITGEYVFILHSDDLLPDKNFFENAVSYMADHPECEGLYGDLIVIDEKGLTTGIQKVKRYSQSKTIPPLQLLWLGRNLYSDVAFHRKNSFVNKVRKTYLEWNMPMWLDFQKEQVNMLGFEKWDKPVLRYRVHAGNYINNNLGKLNVLNGELRTAINLMNYYSIPVYKIQYYLFRIFNKIKIPYRVFYKEKKTDDRADTIRFIVEKRLSSVEENIYYKSIYNFYKRQSKRSILIDNIPAEVPVYWGKDVRKFNKDLLNHTLHKFYLNFMNEMNNGFDKIIVTSEQDYDKIKVIINFMCINNVKVELKG